MTARQPSLTDREFHVAWLVMRGWTNPEIAKASRLTLAAVKNDLSQMLRKLGLQCRTELAVWVLRVTGIVGDTAAGR
jgi:DNA-binding NarL/FixJ family response regulator